MIVAAGITLGAIHRLSERDRSIAVLPFVYDDAASDTFEPFAAGLHDEMLSQLTRIGAIDKVIARQSVMRYRGTEKSIRDIGRELDVGTILEATVRREGPAVRVVARLVDVESEGTLWTTSLDRDLTTESLLSLQAELAIAIAIHCYGIDPSGEHLREAEKAIRTALALRPDSGEAHLAWANYLSRGLHEHAKALAEFASSRLRKG